MADIDTVAGGAPLDTPASPAQPVGAPGHHPAFTPGAPASEMVRFEVVGDPKPKGSKRGFVVDGHAVLADAGGADAARWFDAVATVAHEHAEARGAPLDGALELAITFRFKMPKSRPAAVRRAVIAPRTTAPDLSKLVRAVEDAMQAAGLIADDARIARLIADKIELIDSWSGAEICVRPLRVGLGGVT